MAFEINCIEKDDRYNPYEAIISVGGPNPDGKRWKLTQQEVIQWIAEGHEFFVNSGGKKVWVVIGTSKYNNPYIKTQSDEYEPNNLLSLNACPW
ncbi:MAG: DUF3892 domain-containing protein [Loktanella sp.]|nr:DUF3892 domain-containing protein [Loktanella sp.]